ncbi:MAG TPA: hypothetical protein VJ623_15415 [Holophagaceae bacterium]|nr:hypothetical protein [Holophagaceae bacterium]
MPSFERGILVTTAALLLLACQSDKPEAQAKKALSAAVAAVEAGDVEGAMEVLHPDFQGSLEGESGLTKPQARLLLMAILRQGKVGLTLLRVDARLEGADVLQEIDALASQGGERTRRHWLFTWAKKGGTYKLRRIQELQ